MQILEGSEQVIPCDLLLIAAGFTGIEAGLKDSFDLETTSRNVIVTENYQTQDPQVSPQATAAGDSLWLCGPSGKAPGLPDRLTNISWAIPI